MTDVDVLILHPTPAGRAGEIETWVADARASLAERHRLGFLAAGAKRATVVAGPPDGRHFGARLAEFIAEHRPEGLVVLGSGAIPLATASDHRAFVRAAASADRSALANNRYSADVVAIARVGELPTIPDLATDNALPRWLAEQAGWDVVDLRARWRLGVDVDGPLELVLIGRRRWLPRPPGGLLDPVIARLAAVRGVAFDPEAELIVMGRMSAAGLAWLERSIAARVRAIVEERGMRTAMAGQRRPRSLLGLLLNRTVTVADREDGMESGEDRLGDVLAELGDAALIDSRVLIAHEVRRDGGSEPGAGDRFASDLLLSDRIGDPWLRGLTISANEAPIPILLGGHSLVGPGLRLALGRTAEWT